MDAYGTNYLSPVAQKDAVEIGKILRRMGYVKDKHQRRENGKKLKRMWRRVDAHYLRRGKPQQAEAKSAIRLMSQALFLKKNRDKKRSN